MFSHTQNTPSLTRGLTHRFLYFCNLFFKEAAVTEDSRACVCTMGSASTLMNSAPRAAHQLRVTQQQAGGAPGGRVTYRLMLTSLLYL